MTLKVTGKARFKIFDRESSSYQELQVKNGNIRLKLDQAGAAIVLVDK